jgi:5-methylcytosine-specific restriction enzyme A
MPLPPELLPTRHQRVIDVVEAAGIDVADWANYASGKRSPAANPNYCYSWCFTKPGEFVLLNLWHEELTEENGVVYEDLNYRELALQFERNPKTSTWARRARDMDLAIQKAWREKLLVKVSICDGKRREIADPDSAASRVERRLLDTEAWAVTDYDWDSGRAVVTRGVSPEPYLDQFSVEPATPGLPTRTPRLVDVTDRSAEVRRQALRRSHGLCQWCQTPGFLMPNGRIFLETHHVVPLAEGGLDIVANVVALCANHHRECHHGNQREQMRAKLLAYLNDA